MLFEDNNLVKFLMNGESQILIGTRIETTLVDHVKSLMENWELCNSLWVDMIQVFKSYGGSQSGFFKEECDHTIQEAERKMNSVAWAIL